MGTVQRLTAAFVMVGGVCLATATGAGATSCTIIGTQGDDTLTGTEGPDVICGLGGDDIINALGGDDIIYGGPGNDTINAGMGSDQAWGGDGDDVIDLGGEIDTEPNKAGGGKGSDLIEGSGGPDRLYSGPGPNDVLNGNGGNDVLIGHASYVSVPVNAEPTNRLNGGDGNDRIYSAGGNIFTDTGVGDDLVYGSPYKDRVTGPGYGSNRVFTKGGNDEVYLNADNRNTGPEHADIVGLGAGDDYIDNVSDYSTVYGGPGGDVINVDRHHSFVTGVGGPGDDDVEAYKAIGGPGKDYLTSASFIYARDGEQDVISGGPDSDCYLDDGLDDPTTCGTVH